MLHGNIDIPVFRIRQRHLLFYLGVLSAQDIRFMWDIERFRGEELEDGYQRQLYEERTRELAEFLNDSPIPLIPAVLLSVREGRFQERGEGHGVLSLEKKRGSLWVIDGQHRLGGFEELYRRYKKLDSIGQASSTLSDLQVPVVFLDLQASLENVKSVQTQDQEPNQEPIKGEDLEKALFFVQNETAKKLRPSHRDVLAYRLVMTGLGGTMPVIKRRGAWRVEGTRIVHALNMAEPFKELINIAGFRGMQRPVQLASFVSSLEPLLTNERFYSQGEETLNADERLEFCRRYWRGIKGLVRNAFSSDKKLRDRYLVLKVMGVYALNCVANDIFNWITRDTIRLPSEEEVQVQLSSLKDFEWDRNTSPIAGFGGKAGVKRAHRTLLEKMREQGSEAAAVAIRTHFEQRRP